MLEVKEILFKEKVLYSLCSYPIIKFKSLETLEMIQSPAKAITKLIRPEYCSAVLSALLSITASALQGQMFLKGLFIHAH